MKPKFTQKNFRNRSYQPKTNDRKKYHSSNRFHQYDQNHPSNLHKKRYKFGNYSRIDQSDFKHSGQSGLDYTQLDQQLNNKIKTAMINVLKNDPKPMPENILLTKTIYELKQFEPRFFLNKYDFIRVLNNQLSIGTIKKNLRNKYHIGYLEYPEIPNSTKEGIFQISFNGQFGFVNVQANSEQEMETKSYFVHKNNFHNAIDGDLVKFVLLDTDNNLREQHKNEDAKIIEVLAHAKDCYVGEVKLDSSDPLVNSSYYVELDNPKINEIVTIENPMSLVLGHKVLIKITNFLPGQFSGQVIQVLGHKNDVGVDISSIVHDFGLQMEFPNEVIQQVNEIDTNVNRFLEQPVRRDLTNTPFITIDPTTSKDFDDAIYVEKHLNHFFLQVAVADVSSYFPYQSPLDQNAYLRGTSVYLLNSVIPMLPHMLSDNLCSLMPGVLRCALICDLIIDLQGKIQWDQVNVYPAMIKSHRRFSYDEVNAYFEKKDLLNDDTEQIKTVLEDSYQLFKLTQQEKLRRGYINFNIPEVKVIVDDKNYPIDVQHYKRWHAQMMIEDFMVAANEGVAYFMEKNNIPPIYRVHEQPQIEALKKFALTAKSLNFNVTTKIDQDISSKDIAKWLTANPNLPHEQLVHMMLLRCMAKASYSPKNLRHFGLASQHYLHFTSPIRRYPDLLVHRLLWMYLFDSESYTNQQRHELANNIANLSQHCSQTELLAVEVERAVKSYKFAEYMTPKIGEIFTGLVISINPKGFYVQLENGIEGFTLVMNSPIDFFEFNPDYHYLIGKNTRQKITLGTKVLVKLTKTNLKLKSIEFSLEKIISVP